MLAQAKGDGDWRRFIWDLQCAPGLRERFSENAQVNVFAQQNNYQLDESKAKEIKAREQRLALEIDAMINGQKETNGNGAGSNGEEH